MSDLEDYLSDLQSIFPQVELKSFDELNNLLQQIVPKMVHKYLISGKTIKNCSGVSRDFAEIATQAGFACLIQNVPGHFRNILLLTDGMYVVDISHIQFELDFQSKDSAIKNYKKIYNDPFKCIKVEKLFPQELNYNSISLPHGVFSSTNPNPVETINRYDIAEEEEIFPERFKKIKEASNKIMFNSISEILLKASKKFELISLAGNVVDLKKKLEEKQKEEEKKKTISELSKIEYTEPEIEPYNDIEKIKEKKNLQHVFNESGAWAHRFSKIRKDADGFFILKSDNQAGKLMKQNQMLADYAMNKTPYWKISSIVGERIGLEPIAPNPFATGIGAGGAKIFPQDIEVFTGDYEKKQVAAIKEKMENNTATIDHIKYLLLGTVPVNFGPNGPQGGWYNVQDTRANRGGNKGIHDEKQIMTLDAKTLKDYGFPVPRKALDGTLDPRDWGDWVGGSGDNHNYYPKDLNKFIEHRKQMTEKGKWNYSPERLEELKIEYDPEVLKTHWESIIKNFAHMSKEEFELKHKYLPYNLKDLISTYESRLANLNAKKEKATQYLSEDEDDSIESVLKNIFNPERRVAIRNVINLIGMAEEDPQYIKYLKDFINLGGNDWFANEKVINFFDRAEDMEGLKLCAVKLKDQTNIRYALAALLRFKEKDFVIEFLNNNPGLGAEAISSAIYGLKGLTKGKFGRSDAILDFVKNSNLVTKLEKLINSDSADKYYADDLIHYVLQSFGPNDFWQPGDAELVKQLHGLLNLIKEKNK